MNKYIYILSMICGLFLGVLLTIGFQSGNNFTPEEQATEPENQCIMFSDTLNYHPIVKILKYNSLCWTVTYMQVHCPTNK